MLGDERSRPRDQISRTPQPFNSHFAFNFLPIINNDVLGSVSLAPRPRVRGACAVPRPRGERH